MSTPSFWIVGSARSGKTTRLIDQIQALRDPPRTWGHIPRSMLVFSANGDTRMELADRMATVMPQIPVDSATPLGFFEAEVRLFWPLLAAQLHLQTQFPLRLRPETEQELATRLWQPELDRGMLRMEGVRDYFVVRRILDVIQLAGVSGTPIAEISQRLQQGLGGDESLGQVWAQMGIEAQRWRQWCFAQGLLTYGFVAELYGQYLLPHPQYQPTLKQRYWAVAADDVDDYPAIAHTLVSRLLDEGLPGVFTYNPDGALRWGLGADPEDWATLARRCQVERLVPDPGSSLGEAWGMALVNGIEDPMTLPELPDRIQGIQTVSRADLLRQTAERIHQAIAQGEVKPQDIAVIGPGVDAIAQYTLRTILGQRGIAVESLNDQQPLASSPMIRALLTVLALVYPGWGRLLDRPAIAEMLVILSGQPRPTDASPTAGARIDPARAGLLTDHCFLPDPQTPKLLPIETFPRWDRLGYAATSAYQDILLWLDEQQQQQSQRMIPSPVTLLDRAIQRFLYGGSHLPSDQLALLRELMETAQHYWEVEARLRRDFQDATLSTAVGRFIQLLREGTITADPYPVRPLRSRSAVTLATIFQYRAHRCAHRWHFWLDAGSALWLTGGGALLGAPLFLQRWAGERWTAADELEADQQRLRRQVLDLLGRVSDRLYLCHSDLSTNGQDQAGPLLSWIHALPGLTLIP